MATSNKFLAPKLQSPSVTGRTPATFSDNREKTATPLPYIETITPGKNGAEGFIGYTDDKGNTIPEGGAYIYIYINGFLINPPTLAPDGSFINDKTSILSREDGSWETSNFFFDALPAFQYGQTITFRAKAPLKQISDRSIPYAIGGMPSAIELGVRGDYGILRPPYEGESSITGRVSYWMGHTGLVDGVPIQDCSNHVYVYIDGVHAGTSGNVLGEIFRNEVRGIDAKFPFSKSLYNQTLSLMVDTNQVDIPLVNLQPIDSAILLGDRDGVNGTFTFLQPAANLGIKLFKNGARLLEGLDFNYSVNASTSTGTIQFNYNSVVPTQSDRLLALFQYEAGSFVIGEIPAGTVDGANKVFRVLQTPRWETFELYKNGLHLTYSVDYTISGREITMSDIQTPEVGDLLVADYQPAGTKEQYVYSQIPIGMPDGVRDEFMFVTPNIIGNPHIFRNGLLQREGAFHDFTVVRENVIKFNPWAIPDSDDELLVTFYATPILLSQIVDYLNQTPQFKENCLVANTLNIKPIVNYVNIEGECNGVNPYFTLPLADSPVNLRLFKNGLRQKEDKDGLGGDYFIDYVKGLIVFTNPPEQHSIITGLFNYIIADFVVGEVPKGATDGQNVTFHTSMVPKANTVQVYYNGIRLNPYSVPADYVVSQNQINLQTISPVAGDTVLVDYEIAFGFDTYTSTIIPSGQITGYNGRFSFPTQEVGTAISVYKNGLLQKPNLDYIIDRTSIQFSGSAGPNRQNVTPQPGDSLLVEFNKAGLFTNNPNDQLRIISPYPLDIKRYSSGELDFAQTALFGSGVELYPGKDDDGEFRFFFNRRTGYWKWTWYDPNTGVTTPFITGQRITARAKNDRPFIYKTKR